MGKILVIEDEEILNDNISSALLVNNYEVHTAKDGLIGYELAVDLHPDLILCDIMMPVKNGYWLWKIFVKTNH